MKSTTFILAIACLSTSTNAAFDNATLDSSALDSGKHPTPSPSKLNHTTNSTKETLDTVLIGKTTSSSPLALIRRAFTFGGEKTKSKREDCPKIWFDIAEDFKREFKGCSRKASSAIRFSFHDAGSLFFPSYHAILSSAN